MGAKQKGDIRRGGKTIKRGYCWVSISFVALLVLVHASAVSSMEANAILLAARPQASDPPTGIHLTWGQDDTAHTIVVTWETSDAETGDLVLYDTQSRGGDPDLYENSATGSHHTYSGAGGYIHDVELTGLSADTIYYFICGGENGGWSDERSFRTAPDQRVSFRFVEGGDSQHKLRSRVEDRDAISQLMAQYNPSFVLFPGDIVDVWDSQAEWDNLLASFSMYWIDNNGLTIPIIPAVGNHDVRAPGDYDPENDATNYYGQFNLPGNEQWYALSWGPDLRIIVLDTETQGGESSWPEQLAWLENELIASENYLWKIVVFHRDMVSYRSWPSQSAWKNDLAFLFDKYHVDLVMQGHAQVYERSYPLDWTRAPGEIMSPGEGVVYMVGGAWGGGLYQGEPTWFSAKGPLSKYCFQVIDLYENGTLHIRAIDIDGNVFDEYVLQKEVSKAAEMPIAAISAVVIVAAAGALFFIRWKKSV